MNPIEPRYQFPIITGPFGSPPLVVGSSCLLSNENGGMRQSNMNPSSLSIRKVPLKIHMNNEKSG